MSLPQTYIFIHAISTTHVFAKRRTSKATTHNTISWNADNRKMLKQYSAHCGDRVQSRIVLFVYIFMHSLCCPIFSSILFTQTLYMPVGLFVIYIYMYKYRIQYHARCSNPKDGSAVCIKKMRIYRALTYHIQTTAILSRLSNSFISNVCSRDFLDAVW